MGQEKKKPKLFVERHVLPPRSWIAIVKAHNKRGKVIQIAAQLCSPGICFSILHLPMCTKGHLCTCALNIFFFYRFPGPYPFSFSKACKWMTAAHNAGIQIHFMMTGSLGPLFLRSFVCQRDYCNISGLQYPHLSLWRFHSPNLTAGFVPTFSWHEYFRWN